MMVYDVDEVIFDSLYSHQCHS